MPRRPLRCCVELTFSKVSAPGVWLSSRGDVYLSISLFSQYRNTLMQSAVFPLNYHEQFRFEKTFYMAMDPSEVTDYLEDELVVIELIQLSDYTDGAVRLASYSSNARDFLYPYPSLSPNYASTSREVLMPRTVAFPGITPKLHFTTRTTIKESLSPEVDALEDALDEERELLKYKRTSGERRSRSRTRTCSLCRDYPQKRYERPTVSSVFRSRSPSLTARLSALSVDDIDLGGTRPPFVVRKLDTDLIGRTPGLPVARGARSRSRGRVVRARSRSLSAGRTPRSLSRGRTGYNYRNLHDYKYDISSDDDYDSSLYTPRIRPRSASPTTFRRSLSARFLDRPYSPLEVSRRVDEAIELNRSMERINKIEQAASLNRSLERLDHSLENMGRLNRLATTSYVPSYTSRYPYTCRTYGCTLDDLDLTYGRHRRYPYF